jgi:hypothetical protein
MNNKKSTLVRGHRNSIGWGLIQLIPNAFILLLILLCDFSTANAADHTKESALINQYSQVASKKEGTLIIHLNNKKDLSFKSDLKESDARTDFTLLDYDSTADAVMIEQDGYESIEFFLIGLKDGKKTVVVGPVNWSLDHEHFIATGEMPKGDSTQDAYQLGKCSGGVCKVETPAPGKVTSFRWTRKDRAELTFQTQSISNCSIQKEKLVCTGKSAASVPVKANELEITEAMGKSAFVKMAILGIEKDAPGYKCEPLSGWYQVAHPGEATTFQASTSCSNHELHFLVDVSGPKGQADTIRVHSGD